MIEVSDVCDFEEVRDFLRIESLLFVIRLMSSKRLGLLLFFLRLLGLVRFAKLVRLGRFDSFFFFNESSEIS